LSLYRQVLRVHRQLPVPEMRFLGDQYARDEFRRHQHVDNPAFVAGFLNQWDQYVREMGMQLATGKVEGKAMDPTALDQMNDQQIGQLWELRTETKKP
ncbi:ACN9-domain-containing protein, partial [Blastocladiella britannica]